MSVEDNSSLIEKQMNLEKEEFQRQLNLEKEEFQRQLNLEKEEFQRQLKEMQEKYNESRDMFVHALFLSNIQRLK